MCGRFTARLIQERDQLARIPERDYKGPMVVASFELSEPRTGEVPVVVEVPHAGLWMDPESMAWTIASARSLARDADLYADELSQLTVEAGATLLISRASRYLVDLNRAAEDVDGLAVIGAAGNGSPRGVVWRLTAEGEPALQSPIPQSELERRLDLFYRPYHAALEEVVRRKRERFGGVVVVSLHSMPSVGKSLTTNQATARADVVVGSRGQTTASPSLISLVDEHTRSFGWSVAHDDPYRGGSTTGRLGRPAEGIHAVQVELARRLYMNETSLARKESSFGLVQSYCRGLVARIGQAALG